MTEVRLLTEQARRDIEGRVEKATPGEWGDAGLAVNQTTGDDIVPNEWLIEAGSEIIAAAYQMDTTGQGEANADFIAHARTDVPALLASDRAWKAIVEGLVEALQKLEWLGVEYPMCPACGIIREHAGHRPDCTTASALLSARKAGEATTEDEGGRE